MDKSYPTKSWVITRKKFDPYGLTTFGETLTTGSKLFVAKALWRSRKYDLIQVHYLDRIVPWLKRIYRRKPVILLYVGSDIRRRWDERSQYWQKADLCLVSTPSLLEGAPTSVEWLPNPVDTDLFYPRASERKLGHAFHISYGADALAQRYAAENRLKLTIHNRHTTPIPYTEMGEILSSYEYYIDVKTFPGGKSSGLSKTGLEALACGCKVVRWDGEIVEGLPSEHHPENVVAKLWKLYRQIL